MRGPQASHSRATLGSHSRWRVGLGGHLPPSQRPHRAWRGCADVVRSVNMPRPNPRIFRKPQPGSSPSYSLLLFATTTVDGPREFAGAKIAWERERKTSGRCRKTTPTTLGDSAMGAERFAMPYRASPEGFAWHRACAGTCASPPKVKGSVMS